MGTRPAGVSGLGFFWFVSFMVAFLLLMVIFKFFYFILIFFLCWGGGSFCCCYFGGFFFFFPGPGIDFVGGFFCVFVCMVLFFPSESAQEHISRYSMLFSGWKIQALFKTKWKAQYPLQIPSDIQNAFSSPEHQRECSASLTLALIRQFWSTISLTNVLRSVEHHSTGTDIPQMQLEWATGAHQRSCWSPILLVLCRRWNQESDSPTCQKLQSDPKRQDWWLWLLNTLLSPLLWLLCD